MDDLFPVAGYHTRFIDEKDVDALQMLLEKCVDYMLLVDGHPAGPTAAASLFSDYPPGWGASDLLIIGIFSREDHLVGLLHAVRDYPQAGACWIGLFLVDPQFRSQGLGKKVIRSFEAWLRSQATQGLLLGVVEQNDRALRFWQSLGFVVFERRPPAKIGDLTHEVIAMAHPLSEASRD
jgi:ribosomal protein S18 acetylase RimI-like enzyme